MTSDQPEAQMFREEPVDISRKYGASLLAVGLAVFSLNHFYDPEVAAVVGGATLTVVGIGFLLPAGNNVIRWRTVADE